MAGGLLTQTGPGQRPGCGVTDYPDTLAMGRLDDAFHGQGAIGFADRVPIEPALFAHRAHRAVFVECTPDSTARLAHDLDTALEVDVTPLGLDRIADLGAVAGPVDLVVTTFFHFQEVSAALAGTGTDVAGIHHGVSYESRLEIARIPPKSHVAIVGTNTRTVDRLEAVVRDYTDAEMRTHVLEVAPVTAEDLAGSDVVVEVASVQTALDSLALEIPRVVVSFQIQPWSMDQLRQQFAEIRQRQLTAAPS